MTDASAQRRSRLRLLSLIFVGAVAGTVVLAWVLVTMFARKQEAKDPFPRLAEVSEISTTPRRGA